MRLSPLCLAAAVLAGPATPALAAAPACTPPPGLAPSPVLDPPAREVVSGVPVAAYVLALTWTPEWCRAGGAGATAKEMECGRPLGFTLHGLWPDGAHPPYPRFCHPAGALDVATVRSMYCRTPSPVLLQHEWQAHGTCAAWATPQAYFGQASALYDRIVVPRIETIPANGLTAGAVRAAFVSKNPWLTAEEIFIQSQRDDQDALSGVRVCYDLKFKPVAVRAAMARRTARG
ncbi:ribonuclease T [Phenylobacterium sp.]|uniref:ribonuclease T2 family protein n=1 Tax=Phenylobacterium sp. TaxID=1871053 RepID=UPI0025CDE2A5|nr:ribonuclease T [Phenylobacterium sp.]